MKKLRTRQHIIEDLGFNHIEKQILLAGNVRKFVRIYLPQTAIFNTISIKELKKSLNNKK